MLQLVLLVGELRDASLETDVGVARRLHLVVDDLDANGVVVLHLSHTGALLSEGLELDIGGGLDLGLCALDAGGDLVLLDAGVVAKTFELLVIGDAVVHDVDDVAEEGVWVFVDSFLELVGRADVVKTLLFAILMYVVEADANGVGLLVLDDGEDGLALGLERSLKGLSA